MSQNLVSPRQIQIRSFYQYNNENIIGEKCQFNSDGLLECNNNPPPPQSNDLICTNYTKYYQSASNPDETITIKNSTINTSQLLCYTFDLFQQNYLPDKITTDKFDDNNLNSINRRIFLSMNDPFTIAQNRNNNIEVTSISPKSGNDKTTITINGKGFLNATAVYLVGIPDAKNNGYLTNKIQIISDFQIRFNVSDLITSIQTNFPKQFKDQKNKQFGVFVGNFNNRETSYINKDSIFTLI